MILYSSVSDLASGKANTIHTISQIWGYQSVGIKCLSLLLTSKFQFISRQRIQKDFGGVIMDLSHEIFISDMRQDSAEFVH